MLNNVYFDKMEIYSDVLWVRKNVFSWEFKKVNFLFWKNNSWKTTFFHIFKDILWNPNVAWNNTSWKNILTEDLLKKWLEVRLIFSIWGKKFYTIKEYRERTRQLFYHTSGEIIWSLSVFIEYLENQKILVLPKVIYWWKNKITLNSLMRFCFIEQSHFWKNFRVEKHKSSNIIIKHYNDWRTKVLLYLYVFNILTNEEKLTEYYEKLAIYSDKENQIKDINKQIISLSNDNSYDLESWLFDDRIILKKIKQLENKKRQIVLNNMNYNDIIQSLKNIYDTNQREFDVLPENYKQYLELLKKDILFINQRIINNTDLLQHVESKINQLRWQIETIDKMLFSHFLITLENLNVDDKNLLKSLYKNQEELKIEIEEYKEYYNSLIDILRDSWVFNLLETFVNEFIVTLNMDVWLEINLESWKYVVNTTSDSINRIVLFNLLLSFIFLKEKGSINHLWFIVFDSPFAWLDKSREIEAINNFLDNFEKYLFTGQVFIFLNPDEISEADLSKSNEKDISIKKAEWKLFNFD